MLSDYRYLEKLEFDPQLRKSWLNFFVSNFRVVILLILLLTGAGLYSFFKLPRESDPEVKIPMAVVAAVYPGASPADVEELVTKRMETSIASIKGIDTITSRSSNSFSVVTVEFDVREDLEESIRRLRDKVASVAAELPAEVEEPQVTEVSLDDQPVLTMVLTGDVGGFTLRDYADTLKDELEKIPGVREVNISGGDERELSVAYDPQRMRFYGITADQANAAIASHNIAIPAGNFEGERFIYSVRADARVFDAETLGMIPVGRGALGAEIALRDVARVEERAVKKTTLSRLSIKGSPSKDSVTLSLVKRTGASILTTADDARATADRVVHGFPGVTHDVTLDMSKFVREDFDRLGHDFMLTLALVFGILFIMVGLKEAFVAGLAIPLVFFATFAALLGLGISLNFLSVFSLILSLGLLVDDAIVVVSATKQYLKSGKFTPEEAVLLVLNDFKVVLTTTTLTTVWAFLPLLFSTGIIGEYVKSIPITVSITLTASLVIALMINHPLAAVLERMRLTRKYFFVLVGLVLIIAGLLLARGGWTGFTIGAVLLLAEIRLIRWYDRVGRVRMRANEDLVAREWEADELIKQKLRTQGSHETERVGSRIMHGLFHLDHVLPAYERALHKLVVGKKQRRRVLALTVCVFIIAMLLPVTGVVKSEFFPVSDIDYAYVDIVGQTGLKLEETDRIVRQVEEGLRGYPEILNFSTIVGRGGPFTQTFGPTGASSHIASITLTLVGKNKRALTSYEFSDVLRRELPAVEGATIKVATPANGPPAGSAFEARIKGDDLTTLERVVHELLPHLSAIPGVINTDVSLKSTAPEYTFALDARRLREQGLTAAAVGGTLRMGLSGLTVSTVIREGDEIDVTARFDEASLPTLEHVEQLQVQNALGQPVFLKDVADITLTPSVDSISRIDQKRVVLLSAGVDASTNANNVLAAFKRGVADYMLPSGYEIVYGGENEQNAESVLSVVRAMIIAFVLIIATLVIQFNSFKKSFIVLMTIPLALIGVFFGLAVFGVSLSFPCLIGILALFGIVVKNAIILVDKINLNIKSEIPFVEAIVDAGKSRLEAIVITSVSTICGILPITLSNELWRSLGGAVIFGLSLSSFLTLFIIPALYLSMIGEKERF